MNPSAPETSSPLRTYTTTLGVLNVCLVIAAPLLLIGAGVFFVMSYVFNDSGHVPETVAPLVRQLLLDGLFTVILFIWQLRVRKHLFAMLPSALKSMQYLGIAYVVLAIINLYPFFLLAIPPAAIGIWWIVVFSRASTRAIFENHQPPSTLPPSN